MEAAAIKVLGVFFNCWGWVTSCGDIGGDSETLQEQKRPKIHPIVDQCVPSLEAELASKAAAQEHTEEPETSDCVTDATQPRGCVKGGVKPALGQAEKGGRCSESSPVESQTEVELAYLGLAALPSWDFSWGGY